MTARDYQHHLRQLDEHRAEQLARIGPSYDFTSHCHAIRPAIPLPEQPAWAKEFDRLNAHLSRRERADEYEKELVKMGIIK